MHIALGVRTKAFPIDTFLNEAGRTEVTISAAANRGRAHVAQLAFSGNPRRRGGEWRICDQYSHRHPAWTTTAGFPGAYDAGNPPYVLLFKVGNTFHARFALEDDLRRLRPSSRPLNILASQTGIGPAPSGFTKIFHVPGPTRLEEFEQDQDIATAEAFDPKDLSDGRKRIIAAVIRRLGQQAFRRNLILAYSAQCAVTQCTVTWVLEAAHIVPYRGLRTNAVSNGLLLRADIHTLFDLALISIEPRKCVVKVSKLLRGSDYEALDGRSAALPAKATLRPSTAALEYHYKLLQP